MSLTVANATDAAKAMHNAAKMGRDLMGGTAVMRAMGKAYLPQWPAESEDAYKSRLDSSFLFNAYGKTVKDMVGRVFTKSVEIEGGDLAEEEQNIDGQGNDLSTFAKDVMEAALGGCGLSFIMVDSPRVDAEVTRAQAQAQGLRPYLVHVKAEDVLGWKVQTVGSKTQLRQLRIAETLEEDDATDEFATDVVQQVRVLTLVDGAVNVRLYRSKDGDAEWTLHGDYMTGASEITVVPFYANRTGFMQARPPLEDLAWKNVEHWQSSSDQRNILHAARVPILHATGRDSDEGPLVISASTATSSRDPNAKLEWVEHSGAAIGAGRDDLKDLEFQMQVLGLQLLVAGTETATGASLDAAKETAPLSMMADGLKDALEQALRWFTMYQGAEREITVKVNKDFGVSIMTAQEMTALMGAVNTGLMSKERFLKEMARRGFVAEDIDIEDELELIASETPAGLL